MTSELEAPRGPIALISNVQAKRNRKKGAHKRLRAAMGSDGLLLETATLDDVEAAAREIHEAGVGMLAINGGDGTYQKVITSVIPKYAGNGKALPLLLPLRGGTFNALARHITPRGDADRILAKGIEVWRQAREANVVPQLRYLPALKVTNEVTGTASYGFLFAHGLIARIIRKYAAGPKSAARGARAISEAFGSFVLQTDKSMFEMYEAQIAIDGHMLPFERYLSVLCGVLDNTILGMTPFERRFPSRRSFKYLLSAMETSELFGIAPSLFRGKKWNQDPRLPNSLAREVAISSSEGYILDGEICEVSEPTRLLVGVGPLLRFPRLR